jgi:hypothetical protein
MSRSEARFLTRMLYARTRTLSKQQRSEQSERARHNKPSGPNLRSLPVCHQPQKGAVDPVFKQSNPPRHHSSSFVMILRMDP